MNDLIVCYSWYDYCVIKLRNLCDFFAKLGLIHSYVFQVSLTILKTDINRHAIVIPQIFDQAVEAKVCYVGFIQREDILE